MVLLLSQPCSNLLENVRIWPVTNVMQKCRRQRRPSQKQVVSLWEDTIPLKNIKHSPSHMHGAKDMRKARMGGARVNELGKSKLLNSSDNSKAWAMSSSARLFRKVVRSTRRHVA